jgi:hypothetical protein
MLPLSLIGFVLLSARRTTRPRGVCLLLIVMPVTAVYAAYYWAPDTAAQGTMRFLLPTFPLWILAALWGLREITGNMRPGPRTAIVAVLLTCQTVWGGFTAAADAGRIAYSKAALARVTASLREHAAPADVVMAHPRILQHLDFLGTWKLVDPTLARGGPFADRDDGEHDDAPRPMQPGKRQFQTAEYEGLRPLERERALKDDVLDYADGRQIIYVGTETELENMRGAYFHPDNFHVLARTPLPTPPPTRRQSQRPRRATRPESPSAAPRQREGPAAQDRPRRPGLDPLHGAREIVVARWNPVFRLPQGPPGRQRPWR